MNLNLEGKQVSAMYLEKHWVTGKVVQSRMLYGDVVCHTIELFQPINVVGELRHRVIVYDSEITAIV